MIGLQKVDHFDFGWNAKNFQEEEEVKVIYAIKETKRSHIRDTITRIY